MRVAMIGFGEIGKGIVSLLNKVHEVFVNDPFTNPPQQIETEELEQGIDILCIAIPYKDELQFEQEVVNWQITTDPEITVIFSTVPIGTCSKLNAVHFPVEAKHPFIARDVAINDQCYMGGFDPFAYKLMKDAGLQFKVLDKPEYTEFLKLRSTAIYGVNIEFARYSARVAKRLGLDYELVKEYDKVHNRLCAVRGTPEHARYILDPPEGNIGGHCVVPNARLLDKQFPNLFLKEIYRDKNKWLPVWGPGQSMDGQIVISDGKTYLMQEIPYHERPCPIVQSLRNIVAPASVGTPMPPVNFASLGTGDYSDYLRENLTGHYVKKEDGKE